MKVKYEYKTVRVPRGGWQRDARLNFYGSRGWEVISIKDLWQAHVTVSMKRAKPERPKRIKEESPLPIRQEKPQEEKPQPISAEAPLPAKHKMPEYTGGGFWSWLTGRRN